MLYRNKYLESRLFILFILIIGVILLYSISGMLSHWEVVYAHSLPVTESPAPDSIIKKGEPLPSRITIDFSERPQPLVSTITVLNGKNERVDNGNFVIIGDHSREAMTTLNTTKPTDGVYTVSWMTQSSDDGHIARGSYVFGIGNVGPNAAYVFNWREESTTRSSTDSYFQLGWIDKVATHCVSGNNRRGDIFSFIFVGKICW